MQFPDAIKSCFSKYVTFEGRASRTEYWWFFLFNFIVHVAALFINDNLYYLVTLGLFLPALAVSVRRLHDKEKSGWWLLLSFVPLVGAIILLIWFCQEGTQGDNRFGSPEAQLAS